MSIKKVISFLVLVCATHTAAADDLTAKSWLVADHTGNILAAEHQSQVRSIASVTKLMTVLVTLDQSLDLDKEIKLNHKLSTSKRISRKQTHLTVKDLISLSMVASDNLAAANLCAAYSRKKSQKNNGLSCVAAMNRKAKELGMARTKFVEPTGLSKKNISTAEDLIKLALAAAKYELIVESAKIGNSTIKTSKTLISFKNTNALVSERNDIVVSKTGWTQAAGGCIVMLIGPATEEKIIIVLGSKNVRTRINEAVQLIEKTNNAQTLVNEDTHVPQETIINTNNTRELQ